MVISSLNNKYAVKAIKLHNFRNYKEVSIDTEGLSVLLSGHNGAGKTSILEAISLLFPGKGLRNVSNDDIKHKLEENWVVNALVNAGDKEYQINTGIVDLRGVSKRITKINGEIIKNNAELLKYFNVIWLTPQIDSVFLASTQNRRKFFDRIVYNFDQSHALKITEYEKKIKERSLILKMPILDHNWIGIIERDIAKISIEISKSRANTIKLMQAEIDKYDGNFPKIKLKMICDIDSLIHEYHENAENYIVERLQKNRNVDKLSGKTNFGVHRSDFELYHFDTDRQITNCSTGEQKAMLVALIIFQALAKFNRGEFAPVLLLDEIMTHLDEGRRSHLIEIIKYINMQTWITSTDQDFWADINFPAKFFIVKNSGIICKSSIELCRT